MNQSHSVIQNILASGVMSARLSRGVRLLGVGLATLNTLIVAFVLLYSAYFHLQNSYSLISDVLAYRLLPLSVAILTAFFLPQIQLLLGLALLFESALRCVAYRASAMLFSIFLVAQLSAYYRALDISCGCFGPSSEPIGSTSISVAFAAFVLALVGTLTTGRIAPHNATTIKELASEQSSG